MSQWYVKELSELTKVSIRTLHHYDRIDLLKPSIRLPNSYRLYSEADLLKLQQILALKFFGFSLAKIKEMLNKKLTTIDHLRAQKNYLQQQAINLENANQMLDDAIKKFETNGSIDFNDIVKLIEVYHMTEELKKTWAGNVYTDDQLKQFAELKQRYSEKEITEYTERWQNLIDEVKNALHEDPKGPIGKSLAKRWLALVDEVYGNHPELKSAVHDAYKQEKIPNSPFNKDVFDWIEKAIGNKK